MISDIILGKKGSGKSYYIVFHYIIPALKKGLNVFSNMDFGFSENPHLSFCAASRFSEYLKIDVRKIFHSVDDNEIRRLVTIPAKCPSAFRVPFSSLIVIDEIQSIFPARLSHKTEQGVHDFFSYHRHGAVDVVATSQSPKLLDYQLADLFNNVIKIQNLGKFGLGRRSYRIRWYGAINAFEHDSEKTARYDLSIFKLYRSCADFSQQDEVRFPIFLKFFIIGIAIFLGLKLFLPGKALFTFFK